MINLTVTQQEALLASHLALLDWMRARTGPADGTHDMLVTAHNLRTEIDTYQQEQIDEIASAYRTAADYAGKEGELEIDKTAIVSLGSDPGAYVQAWLWVTAVDAGVTEWDEAFVEEKCPACTEKEETADARP